jgi:translocation protein SEC63
MIQIALAYNYFEPVRAAMEMCQHLLQAIPIGGSPLLQLPGIHAELASSLRMRGSNPVKDIRSLLKLEEKDRRKALETLDEKTYLQAINVAKQIPILEISNAHFKGILLEIVLM